MTQLHLTINQEEIQNLINESVNNEIAKSILTKVFNELMEKERWILRKYSLSKRS